jgi:hypothetical protein
MRTNRHNRYVVDFSANPLVVDIARCLLADGYWVTQLETRHRQSVVDVGWAARQAAQLLARSVEVTTTFNDAPDGGLIVTAVLVDA